MEYVKNLNGEGILRPGPTRFLAFSKEESLPVRMSRLANLTSVISKFGKQWPIAFAISDVDVLVECLERELDRLEKEYQHLVALNETYRI